MNMRTFCAQAAKSLAQLPMPHEPGLSGADRQHVERAHWHLGMLLIRNGYELSSAGGGRIKALKAGAVGTQVIGYQLRSRQPGAGTYDGPMGVRSRAGCEWQMAHKQLSSDEWEIREVLFKDIAQPVFLASFW
jgi:hypothetical protein